MFEYEVVHILYCCILQLVCDGKENSTTGHDQVCKAVTKKYDRGQINCGL
jgi:hypothetical protein